MYFRSIHVFYIKFTIRLFSLYSGLSLPIQTISFCQDINSFLAERLREAVNTIQTLYILIIVCPNYFIGSQMSLQ